VHHLFCWAALVGVVFVPVAHGDDDAKSKADREKIQGTWKPVTAELSGKPYPENIRKAMKLVLADGKYTVTIGQQRDEGTVELDSAKEPRAMDIVSTFGPNRGKKIPAIYELSDDTLRICYDLSGKARPKEFKSTAGTQLFLVEYRREKS
jgi:uncharacterized protein (TIGR03067 family)